MTTKHEIRSRQRLNVNATRDIHATSTDHWLRAESNWSRGDCVCRPVGLALTKMPEYGRTRTNRIEVARSTTARRETESPVTMAIGTYSPLGLTRRSYLTGETEPTEPIADKGFFRTFSMPNFLLCFAFLSHGELYYRLDFEDVSSNDRKCRRQPYTRLLLRGNR